MAMMVTASGATVALRLVHGVPVILRVAAILVPLAFGVLYVLRLIRDMHGMDELQIRISLEAVGMACAGIFILAVAYPIAEAAGFVGRLEPWHVMFALSGLAALGYLISWLRYR
jgi:hypothetical protein